ncbi:MAG: hypothetical protein PVS2B3_13830 [Steroidobacteraceae bacterium]
MAALASSLVSAQQAATPTPASPPSPVAGAGEESAASLAASSEADERLVVSGDGARLTGNHGGGGGSLTWLSNFGPGDVIGLGAEYQTVANSHWTLGAFNGALTLGQGNFKTTLYAEAHEGAGDNGQEAFHYSIIASGLITTLTSWLSAQLEERRIDIDSAHGNLPKVGLSLRIAPAFLASVSYAQSFGGNLGTKLGTARLDYVSKSFNWLAGFAYGPVAPNVLNLFGQVLEPAPTLREGFVGIGKSVGRADWQLLGDYQDLDGFKRTTITLNCTVHLSARAQPP